MAVTLYKRLYFQYFGIGWNEFVGCLICGKAAVDLHHIYPRGKYPEHVLEIWNLAPLCREHHSDHKITDNKEYLIQLQKENMEKNGKGFKDGKNRSKEL